MVASGAGTSLTWATLVGSTHNTRNHKLQRYRDAEGCPVLQGVSMKIIENAIPNTEAEVWKVIVAGLRQEGEVEVSLESRVLPLARNLYASGRT